jgi:tetratricopeptide (TPR) repeat protein
MTRVLAAVAVAAAVVVGLARPFADGQTPRQSPAGDREAAYRNNNFGVALLEQYQYESAASAFRDALRVDPSLALAHLNLAIALYYVPDLAGALREATEAARLLPSAPQPPYILGLIARAENREADAARSFERVRELDARDTGAAINLAQIYLQQRKYPEAIAVLRPAVADEPYNVTAAYNLGLALTRAGNADEGRQMMERSQALRTICSLRAGRPSVCSATTDAAGLPTSRPRRISRPSRRHRLRRRVSRAM